MVSISDKDRKILWGRSGNRCALCHRHILVAERTSADDDAVVGDEAHIAAQSPGGPRYDECARGEVDSYENLILLCKTDHKWVDDQPQHFTLARMRQIRAIFEAAWRRLAAPERRAGPDARSLVLRRRSAAAARSAASRPRSSRPRAARPPGSLGPASPAGVVKTPAALSAAAAVAGWGCVHWRST
jgi:hypothetical protein